MEIGKEIKEAIVLLKELNKMPAPPLAVQIIIHHIEEVLKNKNIKWQEI
jgi:hypothetical protein